MVALTLAAMGLNLCVGYTGLCRSPWLSFWQSAPMSGRAYSAAGSGGEIWLPLLLSRV